MCTVAYHLRSWLWDMVQGQICPRSNAKLDSGPNLISRSNAWSYFKVKLSEWLCSSKFDFQGQTPIAYKFKVKGFQSRTASRSTETDLPIVSQLNRLLGLGQKPISFKVKPKSYAQYRNVLSSQGQTGFLCLIQELTDSSRSNSVPKLNSGTCWLLKVKRLPMPDTGMYWLLQGQTTSYGQGRNQSSLVFYVLCRNQSSLRVRLDL